MSELDNNHNADHGGLYRAVFGALCIFTGISWAADELPKSIFPGVTLAVVVLGVATLKALAVMLFFMHLKFERPWKYVLLGPTVILAIGLPLALLPDVGVHYYDMDVPQDPIRMNAYEALDKPDNHELKAH